MIRTPNRIGRATSVAADVNSARRDSAGSAPGSGRYSPRRRTKFSIITTAPSTIRPKSMAPSDIRFADTPKYRIPMKPTSIDIGMTAATSRAARASPRNTNSTMTTSSDPSSRFLRTVCAVRSITSVWS